MMDKGPPATAPGGGRASGEREHRASTAKDTKTRDPAHTGHRGGPHPGQASCDLASPGHRQLVEA